MAIKLPPDSALLDKNFTFGVATAAFQIEGGAQEDGRLESIWDRFCSLPGKVKGGADGKTACDHYHRWQQDVDLLASLNVDAYRLSVAWPRVMTESGTLNFKGVDFYRRVLDYLKEKDIRTHVTLYHWDLPQYLEDRGGWLCRETAYAFQRYVDYISRALGDRVDYYATLNEPFCSAYLGYETGLHAPGKTGEGQSRAAAHHLLLAHGLGMQALALNSPRSQKGIVLNFTPTYPAGEEEHDLRAAHLADQHLNHWYLQPLIEGRYPDLDLVEGPPALPGDMDIISHAIDFLGVNYYTRGIYTACDKKGFAQVPAENADHTAMGWEIYPTGLTDLLVRLHRRYSLPPLLITENGMADDDVVRSGEVNDIRRIQYLHNHIDAVHQAVKQGVDIRGYFVWSLMDNFEWAEGYEKRFGIVYVDYKTQQRIKKASAHAYAQMLKNRRVS